MKVAVLGAGNGGCAVAADMSARGHEVTLIKTSNSMHNDNFKYLLENNGRIVMVEKDKETITNISRVTTDLDLLSEAEVVIVYIQTNYHEELIERMVPYKEGTNHSL